MTSSILSVSQINFYIKSLLESDGRLRDFLIAGEISNFTNHYRSGHLYFSLKDEKSVLKAVMFSSAAQRLKFEPKDGMKVIVRGRISAYEPAGQYQLYAQEMQPSGMGALSLAYEQLKEKLEAEGLFNAALKKSIPAYPQKIGIITSPTGAALQDMLQILGRRWPLASILFFPVLVQGEGAPAQLCEAVQALGQTDCDVILLGRGGGSLEDLWGFNSESLARAVVASNVPVISAVGHETDYTICDFAADLRAPTPSAAAELCTPDIQEELQRMAGLYSYFKERAGKALETRRQQLDMLLENSPLKDSELFVQRKNQELEMCAGRLLDAYKKGISVQQQELSLYCGKLDALSPLKVLSRGYAVICTEKGQMVTRTKALCAGEQVSIRLIDGTAQAEILKIREFHEGKG